MTDRDLDWMCWVLFEAESVLLIQTSGPRAIGICYVCEDFTSEKVIGLFLCSKWCHVKCAHLS